MRKYVAKGDRLQKSAVQQAQKAVKSGHAEVA
jgi:hypothetical protein